MRKISTRALALSLSTAMAFSMTACGGKDKSHDWDLSKTDYIYRDSVPALATYWNPHDWQVEDDGYLAEQFIVDGLYTFVFNDELHPVEDKEPFTGYKILPAMAASEPVDVTEQVKSSRPEFGIPESATSGYAYTIDLNQDACWEDGTPINADTYVYSMKQLLDPKMINYRATDYFTGTRCIAGAEDYFYSGRTVKNPNSADAETMKYALADLVKGDDGVYQTPEGEKAYIGLKEGYAWMQGASLESFQAQGYIPGPGCWDVLSAAADKDGFVPVTDEALDALYVFTGSDIWGNETREQLGFYLSIEMTYPEVEYDNTVGLYKSGDYQITMVLSKALSGFQLFYSLSGNWLVYEKLYESCKSEVDGNMTTNYCTSVDTTMSYGPYKLAEYQTDKALRLVRNEKWYGYTDEVHKYQDPGDNEIYRMYQTDEIRCQVVSETATKKLMFFKGELMGYALQADDVDAYRNSQYVHITPDETIFFFIFNGNMDAIKKREAASDFDTTKYDLETMTLQSFRKAIAVTYDKELLCTTISPARSGGYGLIGNNYIYDPDTGSRYRDTDQAKQVLCDFYSVDVSKFASLDEAEASITGYDPVKAKELFAEAFEESKSKGFITDNDGDGKSDQMIRIEYCLSERTDFVTKTVDYLNSKLAEVLKDTPFEGKVEFYESAPYGNEWSDKIKQGLSDTVLGGWGGSSLNPFSLTDLYTNPAYQYDAKWFDATQSNLTLTVDIAPVGEAANMQTLTMNLKEWSDALNGTMIESSAGPVNFGDGMAEVDTRLSILAGIEGAILQTYDYIPMLQNAGMSLLSQQVYYVVEEYNAILGRGGIEYLKYNYTEDEWQDYIKEQGGELKY